MLFLPPLPGEPLAPFQVIAPDGTPTQWHPGKTTVVCFCAMWCDTWKTQLPRLQTVQHTLKGLPCQYLAISVDGRWLDKTKGANVANLLSDPGGAWTHSIGIDRVPYTLIVDEKGTIRWTESGIFRSDEVARQVRNAMKPMTGGTIYLTFDDFPAPRLNEELLDTLRAEHVPATFFCEGSKVTANADLFHRLVQEGHQTEVHSWDHTAKNPRLQDCIQALKATTQTTPTLYRPPGSETIYILPVAQTPQTATTLLAKGDINNPGHLSGSEAVHGGGGETQNSITSEHQDASALSIFTNNPYDYTQPPLPELTRRILNNIREKTILQLHAGVQTTLTALPKIIQNLRARGFTFKLLPKK